MSFFTGFATGMLKQANAINREKAKQAREDELLAAERQDRMAELIFSGVLSGGISKNILSKDIGSMSYADVAEFKIDANDVAETLNFMSPFIKENRVDIAGLQAVIDAGGGITDALGLIGEKPEAPADVPAIMSFMSPFMEKDQVDLPGLQNYLIQADNPTFKGVSQFITTGTNKDKDKDKITRKEYEEKVLDLYKNKLISFEEKEEFLLGPTDMTAVNRAARIANEVAKTHEVGGFIFPFSNIDFGNADDVLGKFVDLESHIADKPTRDNLINSINSNAQLKSYIQNIYRNNNNYFNKKFSSTIDGNIAKERYFKYETDAPFFLQVLKETGIIAGSRFNIVPTANDAEDNVNSVYIQDNEQTQAQGVEGRMLPEEVMKRDYNVDSGKLTAMATYHEMPQGKNQIMANVDYMTYSKEVDNRLTQDRIGEIATGANLLKVGTQNVFGVEGGASQKTLNDASEIAVAYGKTGQGDIDSLDEGKITRAIFTISKPDAVDYGMPSSHKIQMKGAEYLQQKQFDLKGHYDRSLASKEAKDLIDELIRVQKSVGGSSTNVVARIEQFVLGFVGTGKQLIQVMSAYSEQGGDSTFNANLATDQGTTTESLMKIAESSLGIDRLKKLTRIQALKLTLAAKMARAVDPSGRLSNQDFEIQLQRLGDTGWFSTGISTLESLETVREEFAKRVKDNEYLDSIIAMDSLSSEDRRFMKSTYVKNRLIRQYKLNQARGRSDFNPTQEQKITGAGIKLDGIDGYPNAVMRIDENNNARVFDGNNNDITDTPAVAKFLSVVEKV